MANVGVRPVMTLLALYDAAESAVRPQSTERLRLPQSVISLRILERSSLRCSSKHWRVVTDVSQTRTRYKYPHIERRRRLMKGGGHGWTKRSRGSADPASTKGRSDDVPGGA
jgi:hypothetical protein